MNEQSLRPLGLGEIIDTAFKIYTRHWRALMLLVAIVVVPAGIASYLILDAAVPPDFTEQLNDPTPVIDQELLEAMVRFLGAALLAAVIQAAAAVLATLPATPGGLGTVEALYQQFLPQIGITASAAASAAILDRIINYWFILIVGGLYFLFRRSSLQKRSEA